MSDNKNTSDIKNVISDDINYMFNNNGEIIRDDKPYIIIKMDRDNNQVNDATDDLIYKHLESDYLGAFKSYLKILKYKLNEDISDKNYDDIKELIKDNNKDYVESYLYLNQRCYDLQNKKIRDKYILHTSNAITSIQMDNIKKYVVSKDTTIKEILNNNVILSEQIKNVISKDDLKEIQEQVLKQLDTTTSDAEQLLKDAIFNITFTKQKKVINDRVKNNTSYYRSINRYYKQIDELLIKLRDKYQNQISNIINSDNLYEVQKVKQPKDKTYPLIGYRLFNGSYELNKPYNLNDYNRHKDPINIVINIDEAEYYNFSSLPILYDLCNNNNQIRLLAIDYPLFMAFTQLSIKNGANIPIGIEDAFKHIVENKEVRLRKSNKSYNIYTERMLFFNKLKMTYKIIDKNTKEVLKELVDPMAILGNKRHQQNDGKIKGYIIEGSAVLTLMNDLKSIYGVDFMATYKLSSEYMNDGQKNDIEILNMKAYILPGLLIRKNSKQRIDERQPLINLDELYNQTAILKGKTELNIDDKKTLHNQINTYLNYLINKNLLSDYGYSSDKNKMLSINNLKTQKQRNIKYLKIK